jgi:hypothetical protein
MKTMKEFVTNKAGAKIYSDINKHEFLKFPVLKDEKEEGVIHEVLSVGVLGGQREPVITIKQPEQGAAAYRLPRDLQEWVEHSMGMKLQGFDLFPAKVEFGILNERVFAEII